MAALLGTALSAFTAMALLNADPDAVGRSALDGSALGGALLAYTLMTVSLQGVQYDGLLAPLRSFWEPLLLGVGLVALECTTGLLAAPVLDPKSLLPAELADVSIIGTVALAEGLFAAVLLSRLRTLVLHRQRRTPLWVWRGMLSFIVAATVVHLGVSSDRPASPVALALIGCAGLCAVILTFRQGWVVPLSMRQRLAAAGTALALSAVLLSLLWVRTEGLATAMVGDGSTESIPFAFSVSRPLGGFVSLVTAFGLLYAITSVLVLLFQMPASEAITQRAGERTAFRSLVLLSGRGLDRMEISAAVAAAPVEADLADRAWLALSSPESGSLVPHVVAAEGIPIDTAERALNNEALLSDATRSDRPLLLEQAAADHRVRAHPNDGLGSLVALPLDVNRRTRGLLVASRREPDAFGPDDVAALETFAAQAALALSHADLFEEALERERLARELVLAREVQKRLFPRTLPEISGLDLAAAERPAREVGGDYYDAVRLSDHCLGLVVADVSGKGAAAAFYMAEMKGVVQSAARLSRSPAEFLVRANTALVESLQRGSFISATYAVMEADCGRLTLARAGHCPAILVTENGSRQLRPGGLAIGLDRGPLFESTLQEQAVHLHDGDVLLLFTDGLVEGRDETGTPFGYERLAETARAHRHLPTDALRDVLLNAARDHTPHEDADDDVTLVVLKRSSPFSSFPPLP